MNQLLPVRLRRYANHAHKLAERAQAELPLDPHDWRQATRDASLWPRHRARARTRKVR